VAPDVEIEDLFQSGTGSAARCAIHRRGASRIATALWLMIAAGTNMAVAAARVAAAP
jgi:hypothetical protein